MVLLLNGGLSDGNSRKRKLENGCCSSSSVSEFRYMPRRVLCIRDYPPGCGPNAPPINLRQEENVVALVCKKENLEDGEMRADVVVSDCVRVEFQSREVLKSQIRPEMAESSAGLVGKVVDTTMVGEDEKISTNMEVVGVGLPKNLECLSPELVEELLEMAYQALLKRDDATENEAVSVARAKKLSLQQRSIGNANVSEETVLKSNYLRRRVLVIRDYPPFCGRNVPCSNEKERRRFVLRSKSFGSTDRAAAKCRPLTETLGTARASIVESKRNVRDGNAQKNESRGTVPEPRKKFQAGIKKNTVDVRDSFRKVPKEIMVHSYDKSPKRRVLGDHVGLGCGVDRVIRQGLMASPNSLWKQGKGASKTSLEGGMSRSKLKKQDFTRREKSRIVVTKNKYEAGSSRGNSLKGKSMFAGKAAYEGRGALPVWDEEYFVVHDDEQHNDSQLHDFDVRLPRCYGSSASNSCDARSKVRETLFHFQTYCRKLLRKEEAKLRQSNRIDIEAMDIVKKKGKELNTYKQMLGPVPGVEVGDEFQYRVELVLVGVHHLYQPGIDYMTSRTGEIIAISIVASGGYDDDLDNADVLIYSGQGGNSVGHNKQPEDQKLVRGNLALKNSISEKNPVRVIRGSRETKASDSSNARAKMVMTYTYDGLYIVKRYWQEPGPRGNLVYKFELTRIPGQPELAWKEVKNSKKCKIRKGLCVDDISGGKEPFPICAVNSIDNEKPPPFRYTTRMMYPDWYRPNPPKGCDCTDGCLDPEKCLCAVKNGGEIPYNHNGAIVEVKSLVYECGPSCKCPPSCCNRVSQHKTKIQLEIFKTELRGWGVRSLTSIPSGSFICEYTGELLDDKEADQRTDYDEYLFDIGHNKNDCSLGDGTQTLKPDAQSSFSEVDEDVGYTIDAAQYGNVGRFINHSCSPNLYAQDVLYDHDDKRMPHIMLFAADNIPALQELSYDYNYTVNQIRDSSGNIKKKICYCGSTVCTGRMY
ncbi:histone-lysine N-methyltransferase, H3 lysine-9 specific SUVH5-like [Cornus florida]|uniref:histone-lysine N-methyltransferase, H3 lysine-9 specific SUVH5-like n=1 Tax=Cornus florida TaxID=4283 RepID=UPI00289F0FCD|nr:histone-lysine N-methyltransferase, H3 lysine-9 specific SUVH5-like [Cornus florida]